MSLNTHCLHSLQQKTLTLSTFMRHKESLFSRSCRGDGEGDHASVGQIEKAIRVEERDTNSSRCVGFEAKAQDIVWRSLQAQGKVES